MPKTPQNFGRLIERRNTLNTEIAEEAQDLPGALIRATLPRGDGTSGPGKARVLRIHAAQERLDVIVNRRSGEIIAIDLADVLAIITPADELGLDEPEPEPEPPPEPDEPPAEPTPEPEGETP